MERSDLENLCLRDRFRDSDRGALLGAGTPASLDRDRRHSMARQGKGSPTARREGAPGDTRRENRHAVGIEVSV